MKNRCGLARDLALAYPNGSPPRHLRAVKRSVRCMLSQAGRAFLRTTYCFVAVFLVLVCASPIAGGENLATQINEIFSAVANDKSPGVAVLVRKGGRTVFERGYGVRDLRSLGKIDEQTNFRL